MAIYDAFADQVPAFVVAGNVNNPVERRSGAESSHGAHDQAVIVRDYVKWDCQPGSLQDFAESAVRAYDIATTGPCRRSGPWTKMPTAFRRTMVNRGRAPPR